MILKKYEYYQDNQRTRQSQTIEGYCIRKDANIAKITKEHGRLMAIFAHTRLMNKNKFSTGKTNKG